MVIKEQKGNETIYILSRKNRIWECSECQKQYSDVPAQCSCGAVDKVFTEKDVPVPEAARQNFKVLSNFIYEATEIRKGLTVSLLLKDRVTKSLLDRSLIELLVAKAEVKTESKIAVEAEVEIVQPNTTK